uniref:Light-independent protochlorophyllide reductase subunit B n=1 Tax=Lobochlamys culleus TaxID=51693 RepID=A0A0S2ID85_9CHLO|nr:ChlB subunit of protochlorophyllide reductase [Lobochlamys culleus]
MKLAYWMYAGPAHIGTLRVASSFKNVHAIMHAPLGDDYFNVMRSMLERERDFTPVTASIVDRHVLARGSQEKVVENITRKDKEERPDLIILTPTCTSSILQEDLQNFVERAAISNFLGQSVPATSLSLELEYKKIEKNSNTQVTKSNSDTNRVVLEKQNAIKTNIDVSKNEENPLVDKLSLVGEIKPSFDKGLESDVILADVNHYRVNELQAADRTLEQIVRFYLEKEKKQKNKQNLSLFNLENSLSATKNLVGESSKNPSSLNNASRDFKFDKEAEVFESSSFYMPAKLAYEIEGNDINYFIEKTEKPSANIIGIFTLGFHNQHDCRELKRLLSDLGIDINEVIPEGGSVKNLKNLPKAWFNVIPYREIGLMTAVYLEKEYKMPYVSITPMGLVNTAAFILEIAKILKNIFLVISKEKTAILTWILKTIKFFSQLVTADTLEESVNPNSTSVENLENLYLNYIDQQTRFVSQAAWFSRSIDCQNLTGKRAVVFGDATHAANMTKILSREMGIKVACAGTYCKHDADWFREQVLGYCDQVLITDDHTQVGDMIAQIEPAAIFGTQMERHVGKRLDIPCGVISAPVHIQNFPLGYRPFLGYEGTNQIADLVYNSFSLGMEDHLLSIFGGHDTKEVITKSLSTDSDCSWSSEGLAELNKIPGFVRGKVKRNTEKYARQKNIPMITVEVMYAAKEAVAN